MILKTAKTFTNVKQLRKRYHLFQRGASNALELLKEGRLSAPYRAPFAVLHETPHFKLRRYLVEGEPAENSEGSTIVLVPPLMVSSEIYDISPELSAVSWLAAQGVNVWVVDFGAPEELEGGMERTLDNHILAISEAIDKVTEITGQNVHLGGYSQGGLFCYLTAAYRRCEGIDSLMTLGSPVDLHRNVTGGALPDKLASQFLDSTKKTMNKTLDRIDGLSGALTSSGFKLMSAGKELKDIAGFFTVLHDRAELERREQRRRFLGGEGFVAWPGPALRQFVNDLVVNNRLVSGGMVVNSKSIAMTDITCPIVYFVGSRDEIGRPSAVRAIKKSATNAKIYEVEIAAGHFGLVVGGKSLKYTWPTVADWMCWIDGDGDEPDFEPEKSAEPKYDKGDKVSPIYDMFADALDSVVNRVSDASADVMDLIDVMRWQLPRMAEIRNVSSDSRISIGQALSEQVQSIPDSPFLLWQGSAFTYQEVDQQVNRILSGLINCGIVPGDYVGILMDNHPDYLMTVIALNRMGAVSVLLNSDIRGDSLKQALRAGQVSSAIIIDANHTGVIDEIQTHAQVLQLGRSNQPLTKNVVSLDQHMEDSEDFESKFPLNPGVADQVAMLIFTSGTTGLPKAVKITNQRWSMAALSVAAAATLTTKDTVYCALPLYHASAMLVTCGSSLVGGARLALSPKFSTTTFWHDARLCGATVVSYVGEMCRYLVGAPEDEADKQHNIRLFMGNGMQKHVWEGLQERFAPDRVMEFYASTEGNVNLVNLSGEKIGSVGRSLPNTSRVELIQYDVINDEVLRNDKGQPIVCGEDQAGLLISEIDDSSPFGQFDGYLDQQATEKKILRNVFKKGDAWFSTGDLLSRDKDGDYWFVDRIGDTFRWKGVNVSTEQVTDVVNQAEFCSIATAYGVQIPNREGRVGVVALELAEEAEFDGKALYKLVSEHLPKAAHPRAVRIVKKIETTGTVKFLKYKLREEGIDPAERRDPLYFYDQEAEDYVPMTNEHYLEGNY